MPFQTTHPSDLSPFFPSLQPSPDPASSAIQTSPDPPPALTKPSLPPGSSATQPGGASDSTIALPSDPSKSDPNHSSGDSSKSDPGLSSDPTELTTPIPTRGGGLGGLLQLSDPSAPLPPPPNPSLSPSPPPPFPSPPSRPSPSAPKQPSRGSSSTQTQPTPALHPPPGPPISNSSRNSSNNSSSRSNSSTPFLYPPSRPSSFPPPPPLPTDPLTSSTPSAALSTPLFIGLLVGASLLLSALLLMLYCFVGDRQDRPGPRRAWLWKPAPHTHASAGPGSAGAASGSAGSGAGPSGNGDTAAPSAGGNAPVVSCSGDGGVGSDGSGGLSSQSLSSQEHCDPEAGGGERAEEGEGGKQKRKGKRWRIVRIGKTGSGGAGSELDPLIGSMAMTSGFGLQSLLKEGHKHLTGLEEAVLKNIEACKQLSHITRTSLGPNGMNKMIINHLDKLFVTSDAATIVAELEVQHPAAKLVVLGAKAQQEEVGDGANTVVSLAGELLAGAEELIRSGLHPSEIIAGYAKATDKRKCSCSGACSPARSLGGTMTRSEGFDKSDIQGSTVSSASPFPPYPHPSHLTPTLPTLPPPFPSHPHPSHLTPTLPTLPPPFPPYPHPSHLTPTLPTLPPPFPPYPHPSHLTPTLPISPPPFPPYPHPSHLTPVRPLPLSPANQVLEELETLVAEGSDKVDVRSKTGRGVLSMLHPLVPHPRSRLSPMRSLPVSPASQVLEELETLVAEGSDKVDVRSKAEVEKRLVAAVASKQFGSEPVLCPLIADWLLVPALASKQFGSEPVLCPLIADVNVPRMRAGITCGEAGCYLLTALACMQACMQVCPSNPNNFNVDNVRVAKILGGGLHDSKVVRGMVLKTDTTGTIKHTTKAKIAVFGTGIDTQATETKGTVLIENAEQLENYAKSEEARVEQAIREVAESGATVVVSGQTVGEMALHFCERYKLMVLKISSKFELRRFCRTTGAVSLVKLQKPTADELGFADSVSVQEIGGSTVVVVENESGGNLVATVVLRGSTDSILDDVERAVDDGINTTDSILDDVERAVDDGINTYKVRRMEVCLGSTEDSILDDVEQAVYDGINTYNVRRIGIWYLSRVLPGGGATEIELARRLKQFARTQVG
ncbi:unnamed protein product [Closterium sp. Naga37s-1]|nr:unnamed protein product [Closterium sp. Naga37s-1]